MKIIALTDEVPIRTSTELSLIDSFKIQARDDRSSKIVQTFQASKATKASRADEYIRTSIRPGFVLPVPKEWVYANEIPLKWDADERETICRNYEFHYIGSGEISKRINKGKRTLESASERAKVSKGANRHNNAKLQGNRNYYKNANGSEQRATPDGSILESYNCHPLKYPTIYGRQPFTQMVRDICNQRTYNSVLKNLDHYNIFRTYVDYNRIAAELVMELYEPGDYVWILSEEFLLVPGLLYPYGCHHKIQQQCELKKKLDMIKKLNPNNEHKVKIGCGQQEKSYVVGMRFGLPFSSDLFKCVPFYKELMGSMNCCTMLEFVSLECMREYQLLFCQKIRGIRTGSEENPEINSEALSRCRENENSELIYNGNYDEKGCDDKKYNKKRFDYKCNGKTFNGIYIQKFNDEFIQKGDDINSPRKNNNAEKESIIFVNNSSESHEDIFYKDTLPYLTSGKMGIDKFVIDKYLKITSSKQTQKLDIIVSASRNRLLCIEAYMARRPEKLRVGILAIEVHDNCLDEINRLVEYNRIKHGLEVTWLVPKSDEELIRALSSTSICFCSEVENICRYMGISVVELNPVDYDDVADEIERLRGTKTTRQDVIDKREWVNMFLHKLQGVENKEQKMRFKSQETIDIYECVHQAKRDGSQKKVQGDINGIQVNTASKNTKVSKHFESSVNGSNRCSDNKLKNCNIDITSLKDYDLNHLIIDLPSIGSYMEGVSVGKFISTKCSRSMLAQKSYQNDNNESRSTSARKSYLNCNVGSRSTSAQKYSLNDTINLRTTTHLASAYKRIKEDFDNSKQRTFILDYDGTLTDIVVDPKLAAPDNEILELFEAISKKARVIIATGRSSTDVDEWIPKDIEVYAEHGAKHRVEGHWIKPKQFPRYREALKIAKFIEARTPGSYLEVKSTGFAFHYRECEPFVGKKQATALFNFLKRLCFDFVADGKYIVEARSSSKNVAIQNYGGFMLIAGDDISDEDMFKECSDAYTVKIGHAETAAQYRVPSPCLFKEFLRNLIA